LNPPRIGVKRFIEVLSYVGNEGIIICIGKALSEPHAACFLDVRKKDLLIRTKD